MATSQGTAQAKELLNWYSKELDRENDSKAHAIQKSYINMTQKQLETKRK
jgi:hypothetical protein